MSADPAAVGARVLAGAAKGRARRLAEQQARAAERRELVLRADRLDRAAEHPDRGRPGRIARRLCRDGVEITERRVLQILSETQDGISDSP
jgi:hypothetical protein